MKDTYLIKRCYSADNKPSVVVKEVLGIRKAKEIVYNSNAIAWYDLPYFYVYELKPKEAKS